MNLNGDLYKVGLLLLESCVGEGDAQSYVVVDQIAH